MAGLEKVALVSAVAATCVAVGDAVVLGVTGENLVTESSDGWAVAAVAVVHAVSMLTLAAALVVAAPRVDVGRRWRRWVRRGMVVSLTAVGVMFAVRTAGVVPPWLEAVGGAGFLLSFVLGVVLGVGLLRDPARRVPGVLLASPLLVVPVMVLVDRVAPGWAHPGWAEAGLYLGLALLVQPTAAVGASTLQAAGAPSPAVG